MANNFYNFHPLVKFLYFISVSLFSMFFMHPILLGISFISSVLYNTALKNTKLILKIILSLFPVVVFMTLINCLFNSQGVDVFITILGKDITLQSLIYSLAAGTMFLTVTSWFLAYNKTISSDNFMYMFSNITPKISMIIHICLSSVNRFYNQAMQIKKARRYLVHGDNKNTIICKIQNYSKIILALIMWAIENSVDTFNSMKSRGYGLAGRTNFNTYVVYKRDIISILILLLCDAMVFVGCFKGEDRVSFYPQISYNVPNAFSYVTYISYVVLCLFPVFINIMGEIKWTYLKLKN